MQGSRTKTDQQYACVLPQHVVMLMQTEFFDFEVIHVIDDLRTYIALECAETPFLTSLLFQYQD